MKSVTETSPKLDTVIFFPFPEYVSEKFICPTVAETVPLGLNCRVVAAANVTPWVVENGTALPTLLNVAAGGTLLET